MKILLLIFFCAAISLVHSQSLRLLHPNGGEKFLHGSDILIQWENESDTLLVQLEYSTNNGVDWRYIDTARGFSYLWKQSTLFKSENCLIRVKSVEYEGKKQSLTLLGHNQRVNSVAYSPDGLTLASSSLDGIIKFWNVENGKESKSWLGHNLGTYFIEFNTNGDLLSSCGSDKLLKLWDVYTGELKKIFIGHNGTVYCSAFSPNGRTIATGSGDSTIRIWDLATGETEMILTGHTGRVNSISFSPDGLMLASASNDGSIKLWNVSTGIEIRSFIDIDYVLKVVFDPVGTSVASCGWSRDVKIYDINTGEKKQTFMGHMLFVLSLAFSKDANILASGSNDRNIKLWDVASGKEIRTLIGHTLAVEALAFSPDLSYIASGSRDETIKIWNLEDQLLPQDQSDSTFTLYEEITSIENPKENNKVLTVVQKENSASLEIILDLSDYGISTVKIFNSLGMLLDTKEVTSLGSQKMSFNTDKYSTSTYLILLTTPTRTETASFVVVK